MSSELVDFLMGHWVLTSAFVFSLLVAIMLEYFHASKKEKQVTNAELVDIINNHGVAVDIRDKSDFNSGHIVGSKNIPSKDLLTDTGFLKKNKDKNVVLICRSGHTATSICSILQNKGLKSIKSLEKGISGWIAAELPLAKGNK